MRIAPCNAPAEIRLCSSCCRHPDRQPHPVPAIGINPTTRAERCFDWYAAPARPTPAPPVALP